MFRWLSIAFATTFLWAGMQPSVACACPMKAERTVQVVDPDCPCGQRMIDVPVEDDSSNGCGCACTVDSAPVESAPDIVLAAGMPRSAEALVPAAPDSDSASSSAATTTTNPRAHSRPPPNAVAPRPPPSAGSTHGHAQLQVFRC